jgi:hypothetical protein
VVAPIRVVHSLAAAALCAVLCACGGGGGASKVLATSTPEAGVRREVLLLDAPAPPANPATSEPTPSKWNHTTVLRYRKDAEPPVPVKAVIVAMPGFIAGGAAFDKLARVMVARSAAAGAPIEFWAVDRRSNQLEDLAGMAAAQSAGDPELAWGYTSATGRPAARPSAASSTSRASAT